jgi:hypothetical protein
MCKVLTCFDTAVLAPTAVARAQSIAQSAQIDPIVSHLSRGKGLPLSRFSNQIAQLWREMRGDQFLRRFTLIVAR